LVIVLVMTPWAIRNQRVLGALIWTRSDFGLELQVSNNDLLTADLEHNLHLPGHAMFHPFTGAAQFARVQRLGEVAYGRAKEQQAFAWIASHPRQFLLLTVERFRLFWLPDMRRSWQSVLEAGLTLLGLCGLGSLLRNRYEFAWGAVAVLAAYPAVYYLIQVSPRYRSPVEPILFLLAGHFCASVASRFPALSSLIGDRRHGTAVAARAIAGAAC